MIYKMFMIASFWTRPSGSVQSLVPIFLEWVELGSWHHRGVITFPSYFNKLKDRSYVINFPGQRGGCTSDGFSFILGCNPRDIAQDFMSFSFQSNILYCEWITSPFGSSKKKQPFTGAFCWAHRLNLQFVSERFKLNLVSFIFSFVFYPPQPIR